MSSMPRTTRSRWRIRRPGPRASGESTCHALTHKAGHAVRHQPARVSDGRGQRRPVGRTVEHIHERRRRQPEVQCGGRQPDLRRRRQRHPDDRVLHHGTSRNAKARNADGPWQLVDRENRTAVISARSTPLGYPAEDFSGRTRAHDRLDHAPDTRSIRRWKRKATLTTGIDREAKGEEGGSQERLPGQHEPRAADADERHHRLQRDAGRGGRGRRPRRVGRRPRARSTPPASTCWR